MIACLDMVLIHPANADVPDQSALYSAATLRGGV